jgi:hypothetical protein
VKRRVAVRAAISVPISRDVAASFSFAGGFGQSCAKIARIAVMMDIGSSPTDAIDLPVCEV